MNQYAADAMIDNMLDYNIWLKVIQRLNTKQGEQKLINIKNPRCLNVKQLY